MRRGSIVLLTAIGLAAFVIAGLVAVLVPWLPDQASEEREAIDLVFWITTAICIGIFAVVAAILVYSVMRYRVRPDDDTDGAPIHGHTGLEILWTAVPTVLVIVIIVVSSVALADMDQAGSNPFEVNVTAQQFAWSFEYPNGTQSGDLRLPLERATILRLRANDVIHSFWVPQFGGKQDAVPGIDTTLVVTPTKTGTYPVVCTELCGVGHSLMRTNAVVMEQAELDRWLEETGSPEEGGDA